LALKRNFNNYEFDEFFLAEYFACPYRGALSWHRNLSVLIPLLTESEGLQTKQVKTPSYVAHGKSLEYVILKKSFLKMARDIMKGEPFTLEMCRDTVLFFTEKEIVLNKKKLDKGVEHYNKVKTSTRGKVEQLFELLRVSDLENSIESFLKIKIDLHQYLELRKSGIRAFYQGTIPQFDWDGTPYFKIDITSIKKVSEESYDVVMTTFLDIDEKTVHRNLLVAMTFHYFYLIFSKQKDFIEHFDLKKIAINNIILYDVLRGKRHEFNFKNLEGIFQEMEMFRILHNIINSSAARSVNWEVCENCEQLKICGNRILSRNGKAKAKVIYNSKTEREVDTLI
jgi:hypothetical protein